MDAILRGVTTRVSFVVDSFPWYVMVTWLLFNYPVLWGLKPVRELKRSRHYSTQIALPSQASV